MGVRKQCGSEGGLQWVRGMQPYGKWQGREGAPSFPASMSGCCFYHKHSPGSVSLLQSTDVGLHRSCTHTSKGVHGLNFAFNNTSGPCFHTEY